MWGFSLKKHKISEHQKGKLKCCLYCDYKTSAWSSLNSHIDKNHPEHGEKSHFCDICGKGFIFQASCKIHKFHNHNRKHCHICGKETFNQESLTNHLNSMHNMGDKTYKCKFCDHSTKTYSNLKSHVIAKHNLENHKKCPYCDYHTHAIHRIQIHIDSKHPEHDKKSFICDHCPKRFIYENSLKQHKNNVTWGPKIWAKRKMKRKKLTGDT